MEDTGGNCIMRNYVYPIKGRLNGRIWHEWGVRDIRVALVGEPAERRPKWKQKDIKGDLEGIVLDGVALYHVAQDEQKRWDFEY